jgi:endo-1,4-beta-xylanase
MKQRTYSIPSQSWTRRRFLRASGAALACVAAAPYVCGASQRTASENDGSVLEKAEARIQQHRTGPATLRLLARDGTVLPAGVAVSISQTRHRFLFGCNIFKLNRCRTPEDNAAYAEHFADLLNFATLPFYWWNYERRQGKPQDERTEEIVRWCKTHDVTTKGHPLAWNYVDPPWLTGTAEEVMQLQFKRVERCVRRFQGGIDIWDVVNEATHHDREELKRRAPRLTEAIAKMGIGAYVRTAFKRARRAAPQATLLINDYRTDPAYADKVISELVDDQQRPLYDVIGIQSHMHGRYWGAARAWDVCERFTRFGKPLHFTETTVVSGPKKASQWTTTAEGERRQAKSVAEFYTVLFSHPAVEALTWWDFSDQNAWQGAPAGLLRDDMSPKPAYEALRDLIKSKWWTQAEVRTDADGKVNLRGFFGNYKVVVRHGGRELRGQFVLEPAPSETIDVALS